MKFKITTVRGTCSVCNRDMTVTKAGNVRHHGAKSDAWPPENCLGSGKPPKGAGVTCAAEEKM